MAKNYTELEMNNSKVVRDDETTEKLTIDQVTKDKVLHLILERVSNGSNIDYVVKLSEIYRNIR